MKLRYTAIVVAAFAASVVFAGPGAKGTVASGQAGENQQIAPFASRLQARRGMVNTDAFFPRVRTAVSQKVIRPRNPSIGLRGVVPVESPFNGEESMTSLLGPTAGPHFPGMTMGGLLPADPDVAVGPNNIVQVVNSDIAFYSKAGALQLQQSANTLFASVRQTAGPFDPKVMYDRIAQRFVIIYLEESSGGGGIANVLFGISDDSNPNGVWFVYRFNVKQTIGGQQRWLDYPGFGYNKDGYVFCGNMWNFAGNNVAGLQIVTVPKTPVLTGAPATTTHFLDGTTFTAQFGENYDSANGFVFGGTRMFTNQNRYYAAGSINTATPTLNFADVNVTNGPIVANTAQSTGGAVFDTIGDGFFTMVFRNGHLYTSQNFATSGSITGARWHELNVGNWPTAGAITELQAGNYSNAAVNQFQPAINVNKHGDVSILFTSCNTGITSDIAVAGRITSDAINTMSAPTVLAGATGSPYNHFRWGDYFGVDVDPVDDETFWGTAMVVRGDGWWSSHVVSWTVSKTWPVSPAAFLWVRGVPQSGNAASLANDDGNYNVAKAGLVLFPNEPPAQLQVDATAPIGQVLGIDVSAVAKVNTAGLSQKIELFDWVNGVYVQVGIPQLATTTDSVHNATATGTLSNFVQVGTRAVRAKLSFYRTGLTLVWPWTASVDQFRWNIRTR